MERRDNISTVYFDSPEWIAFGEQDGNVNLEEDGDDSDFEFIPRDPDSGKEITADEMFSNGRIRPAFPLFGRPLSPSGDAAAATPAPELETLIPIQKLLIEDRGSLPASTSSSECDELESIPDATYCAWSPEQKRRSASEGGSRRWRLMDLVEGRSRSDGNKRFVGVAPGEKDKKPKSATIKEEVKKKTKGSKVTELDMVTAHRLYYSKKSEVSGGLVFLGLPLVLGRVGCSSCIVIGVVSFLYISVALDSDIMEGRERMKRFSIISVKKTREGMVGIQDITDVLSCIVDEQWTWVVKPLRDGRFITAFPTAELAKQTEEKGPIRMLDFSLDFQQWSPDLWKKSRAEGAIRWVLVKELPMDCWSRDSARSLKPAGDLVYIDGQSREYGEDLKVLLRVRKPRRLPCEIHCSIGTRQYCYSLDMVAGQPALPWDTRRRTEQEDSSNPPLQ
ncbi:hypothetical protein J5N97_007438 [Dioscorea zingiberensis]|uniref:DUF4283 domain-containing protein n=1 Tax=Dioscorea zingiberensis TaxID=325984 RepID=A0A9D5DF27_9LILI|nr:hypothetical protein J5N97_007438 [Dioscorea zingiberensis]